MYPKILVVDDSRADAELLKHMLTKLVENPVVTAHSNTDAKEFLDSEPNIGLVITDLVMQDNGFDLVRYCRSSEAHRITPVVVMTGTDRIEDIRGAYEAGANVCLVKPIIRQEFGKAIDRFAEFWLRDAVLPKG